MNDHFAEFGIPRVAWIDAEEVKLRHHTLMAASHPDKAQGDGDRATRLNVARRVLENPATRLRHLLELEFPAFHSHEKPQPDWDFFSRTSDAVRLAEQISSAGRSATSPLARAVAKSQAVDARTKLNSLQAELAQRRKVLEKKTITLPLPLNNPQAASHLVEEWIFLNRWQGLLHEAMSCL